jgi:2-dehydro-3-deoxyphosphooctonate aldolase (KDO 8-P synthase)
VARAGISVGADGLFLEIHDNPSQALSDSHNSFNLSKLHKFCTSLLRLKKAVDET